MFFLKIDFHILRICDGRLGSNSRSLEFGERYIGCELGAGPGCSLKKLAIYMIVKGVGTIIPAKRQFRGNFTSIKAKHSHYMSKFGRKIFFYALARGAL